MLAKEMNEQINVHRIVDFSDVSDGDETSPLVLLMKNVRLREAERATQSHRAEWPITVAAQMFRLDLSLCPPHKMPIFWKRRCIRCIPFKQL